MFWTAFHERIEIGPKVIGTARGIATLPGDGSFPMIGAARIRIVEGAAGIAVTMTGAMIGVVAGVVAGKVLAARKSLGLAGVKGGGASREAAGVGAAMTMVAGGGIVTTTRAVAGGGIVTATTRVAVGSGIVMATTRVAVGSGIVTATQAAVAGAVSRIKDNRKSAPSADFFGSLIKHCSRK